MFVRQMSRSAAINADVKGGYFFSSGCSFRMSSTM